MQAVSAGGVGVFDVESVGRNEDNQMMCNSTGTQIIIITRENLPGSFLCKETE